MGIVTTKELAGASFRKLKPGELDRAIQATTIAFSAFVGRDMRPFFQRSFRSDPQLRFSDILCLESENQILSLLTVYKKKVCVGSSRLDLAYIAHVATLPQFQGRGYGSQLLRSTLRYLKRNGFDFSRLNGHPGFYGRLGWETMSDRVLELIPSGPVAVNEHYRIRPFRENADLTALARLYHNEFRDKTYTVHRTHDYWTHLVKNRGVPVENEWEVCIAETDAGVHGYMVLQHRDDGIMVISELAAEPNHTPAKRSLLQAAATIAQRTKAEKILLQIPVTPSNIEFVQSCGFSCRPDDSSIVSRVQVTNLASMFEKILPQLQNRLENARWAGRAGLKISLCKTPHSVSLRILNNAIDIVDELEPTLSMQLSHQQLLGLVLGSDNAIDPISDPSPKNKELLHIVFPPQYPVYFLLDFN